MKKHLYEIKKLDIPAYLKWWFIKKKFAGVLSEVLENLTSPITLQDSLRRKFKIFQIGGNSVQNGEPTPTNPVSIQNVTGDVKVKVKNKNLFNDELELGRWSNSTGNAQAYDNYVRGKNFIEVEGGQTYVGSANVNDLYYTFAQYDENKTFLGASNNPVTVRENCKYIKVSIHDTTDLTLKVQIEQGSTATDYVPHEEQTVTFSTQEGQVLHLGDTWEDDGTHQREKTLVLNGTENFIMETVENRNRFYLTVSDSVAGNYRISVLSSHFMFASTGHSDGIIFLTSKRIYFYPNSNITTLADFKAFLAQQYANGTPVTVEYELAEPIIAPYNEEQQKVYDKIKKLYSYKGITYISSDNEPSPTFTIQYVREE